MRNNNQHKIKLPDGQIMTILHAENDQDAISIAVELYDYLQAVKREEAGDFDDEETAEAGLTLIELMIVIAIIGILAAIAVPMYASYIRTSEATDITQDFRNMVHEVVDAEAQAQTGQSVLLPHGSGTFSIPAAQAAKAARASNAGWPTKVTISQNGPKTVIYRATIAIHPALIRVGGTAACVSLNDANSAIGVQKDVSGMLKNMGVDMGGQSVYANISASGKISYSTTCTAGASGKTVSVYEESGAYFGYGNIPFYEPAASGNPYNDPYMLDGKTGQWGRMTNGNAGSGYGPTQFTPLPAGQQPPAKDM